MSRLYNQPPNLISRPISTNKSLQELTQEFRGIFSMKLPIMKIAYTPNSKISLDLWLCSQLQLYPLNFTPH